MLTGVFLPKVENSDHFRFLFLRTFVKVEKGDIGVLGKSRRKDILVWSKLVSGLSDYTIYDIQSRNLVLGLALLNEFLNALYNMFVEFNGPNGPLGYGSHFSLRYRRLLLV